MRVAVVNGPNLNLLGEREPEIYGRATLVDLETAVAAYARDRDVTTTFFQANGEGAIIDYLHAARRCTDGIIINPGAYTHYSYAIYDALKGIGIPAVEVHLTNIGAREKFRHASVIADACIAQIAGFGIDSYLRAVDTLIGHIDRPPN